MTILTRKANVIEILVDGEPVSMLALDKIEDTYDEFMGNALNSNDYVSVYGLADGVEYVYAYVNS